MAIRIPSALTFWRATWVLMPLALLAGYLSAPATLGDASLVTLPLAFCELFLTFVWMGVDSSLGRWEPQHRDGRRWLRACRALRALLLLMSGLIGAQVGVCIVRVQPMLDVVGPLAMVFVATLVPLLFMNSVESSLETHVRTAGTWNAVRDALGSSPKQFRSQFRLVVDGPLDLALHVLRQATPAQVGALAPADLEPLLLSNSIDARLAAVTAMAAVGPLADVLTFGRARESATRLAA